jgi:hypothetical protein
LIPYRLATARESSIIFQIAIDKVVLKKSIERRAVTKNSLFTTTLFLSCLLFGEAAISDPMACEPNGDCLDPCVYFSEGIVFNENDAASALLKYKGKILTLNKKNEKILKIIDKDAELPGHTVEKNYEGSNIRVVLTSEITSQTCSFQNDLGKWQSTESCCQGSSLMKIRIIKSGKSKVYKANWDWGC